MEDNLSPGGIPVNLVIATIVAGISIGASMIAVVLTKYWANFFHLVGGPMLTVVGAFLVGLSIFGNIQLKVGDFEATIDRLNVSLADQEDEIAQLTATEDRLVIENVELRSMLASIEAEREAEREKLMASVASLQESVGNLYSRQIINESSAAELNSSILRILQSPF